MSKPSKSEIEKLVADKYQRIEPLPGVPTKVAERGVAPYGKAPNGKTWVQNNIDTYGYDCPINHFLYGPSDLTPTAVARIWGLDAPLVCRWAREDNWHENRQNYLAKEPIERGGLVQTEAMAKRREEWSQRKVEIADMLLDTLLTEWRAGMTESASPTGGEPVKRKMNFSDRKTAVSAIREVAEMKDVALGLPSKFAGAFAGATINNNNNQINAMVVEAPPGSTRPPLPAPKSEIVESHVVDSQPIPSEVETDDGNSDTAPAASPAGVLFTTGP